MTEEEIEKAISIECKESNMFKAIIESLKDMQTDEAMSLMNPDLTDSGSHFNRGRLAAVTNVIEELESYLE